MISLNGELLAHSPEQVLAKISTKFGILGAADVIATMINHPTTSRYSKDRSISFGASTRHSELIDLESRSSQESDAAVKSLAKDIAADR